MADRDTISNVKHFENTPYFDDFDETKNYHRILFRPGFAVQARELTQLQTSLQNQIDKLGQAFYSDGDRVLGGKGTLLAGDKYAYIKLEALHNSGAISGYVSEFLNTDITGATSGVVAEVINVVAASGGDPDTLYVKYKNSGTNKITKTFAVGEAISSNASTVRSATIGQGSGSGIANAIGKGSAFNVEEGIYFISGSFVHIPSETIVLDKYTNTPTYIIGLQVTETDVSSTDTGHSLLVDNAQGSPNHTAPGANRYVINTVLIKESDITLASRTVNEYIHLITVENGEILNKDENQIDTEFLDRIETRTKETHGDYVLSPFILDIKEHLRQNNNKGFLDSSQGGNANKIAIGIEPAIAYIDGRRIEKTKTEHVILDNIRANSSTQRVDNVRRSTGFGNFIKLKPDTVEGTPDINGFTTLNLTNDSGVVQATARARGFEYFTDAAATTPSPCFELYIFDVTIASGKSFSAVTKVVQGTSFEAELLPAADGQRFKTGDNLLVYKLPFEAVQTLQDGSGNNTIDFNVRKRLTGSGNVSGGSVSFNIPTGFSLANDDDVIIHAGTLSDNVDSVEVADGTVTDNGTSVTVASLGSSFNGKAATGIFTLRKLNDTPKSKGTIQTINNESITANGSASYELSNVDIQELTEITDVNGNDVTDKFILDNGQRDSFYDRGKIILKGGQSVPAGAMQVDYKCFIHAGAGNHFSVDSYSDYTSIPTYKGLNLRDCIDFRPSVTTSASQTEDAQFTATGSSSLVIIQPTGNAEMELAFHLPRIDKLFLTKEGQYKLVSGVPSINPTEPEGLENSIHLYTLNLNPYVFDVGDVVPTKIDNKRYTMQDIGGLEKRVKRLEYYTSLSLLEKSAKDAQIFSATEPDLTNERFKNGFIVDGFFGHNVGDTSHPDYDIGVDKVNGILRPKSDNRNVNLIRAAGDEPANMAAAISGNKAVKSTRGGIITMPYNVVTEINQPLSSYAEFVNPYNVVVWDGTIKLSPESDEWKDVDQRPDIIIDDNSAYEQFVNMAESQGILGTVWNEWETNWTGREVLSTTRQNRGTFRRDTATRLRGVDGTGRANRARADVVTTTTAVLNTGTQTRDGLETYVTHDTETKEIGNYVVEVNFIPFMRSRRVYFNAELLKPSTKLYAFFNGVNITSYCNQNKSGTNHVNSEFLEFSDQSNVKTFSDKTQWVNDSGATSGTSGVLETDASGRCIGSFIIPRNDALQFKTGTREFKLTDDSLNNSANSTTSASENFYAQGILETYQKTIISTKVPRLAFREVSETNTITRRTNEVSHEVIRWADPLAETFLVSNRGGMFTTGIDIFFAVKDSAIPVQVSIREVENGYPTQRVVPGADVVVYPGDISLPTDTSANAGVGNADTATSINWDFPVFLKEGQEYAIVLISNSDIYKVYVAETSKFDLTNANHRISKQPFNGVFFTSQNASTWTAEQNKDLKFKLKRASFVGDASNNATVVLSNDTIEVKDLGVDPLIFESNVSGNCNIRVIHPNHGMYGGDDVHKVTIAGVPTSPATINGIAASSINGTHLVKDAQHDSYVIRIPSDVATTLGQRGGGASVTASENQMYDTGYLAVNSLEFPGDPETDADDVKITYQHRGLRSKSQNADSGQVHYTFSDNKTILGNKNVFFDEPFSIASATNVTYKSLSNNLLLTCTLSNAGIENLSPVIDLNRTSFNAIQNRINEPVNTETNYVAETSGTGTSSVAKYITKRVELATDGTQLDMFLNINRPTHTSVEVYVKTSGDTDVDFDDIGWTLVNPNSVVSFNDRNEYNEVGYVATPASAFNSFSVKIVLKSQRSSSVPTIKDFRAIATT